MDREGACHRNEAILGVPVRIDTGPLSKVEHQSILGVFYDVADSSAHGNRRRIALIQQNNFENRLFASS